MEFSAQEEGAGSGRLFSGGGLQCLSGATAQAADRSCDDRCPRGGGLSPKPSASARQPIFLNLQRDDHAFG